MSNQIEIDIDKDLIRERLLPKLGTGPDDECWPWLWDTEQRGYGRITIKGTRYLAHRLVAYAMNNVDLSPDMVVRHDFDNPNCCNPKHLRAGTQIENLRDCAQRGRQRYSAVVTEDMVREMRARHRNGERVIDIARDYPISRSQVQSIVTGRFWKSVA